jgi:hypothetical protein
MESTDDAARALTEAISKLAHGCNNYDVQRALVAVMSCGICTTAKSSEGADDLLTAICMMLRNQVHVDYPKIKSMRDRGEVNAFILPTQIM